MGNLEKKYIDRLEDYLKEGFRSCPIDKCDEEEVQKIFFHNDHYYFAEDENSVLWLNWE